MSRLNYTIFFNDIAFNFNNLYLSSLVLIGILLLSKVFLLNFFSSQILAITIDNPYSTIDSIEDLNARKEMQVSILASKALIENFQVRLTYIIIMNFVYYNQTWLNIIHTG